MIYILNHKNPGPSEEKKIKLTYFRLCVKYDKKQKHLNELTRFLEQKVILFFFFFSGVYSVLERGRPDK